MPLAAPTCVADEHSPSLNVNLPSVTLEGVKLADYVNGVGIQHGIKFALEDRIIIRDGRKHYEVGGLPLNIHLESGSLGDHLQTIAGHYDFLVWHQTGDILWLGSRNVDSDTPLGVHVGTIRESGHALSVLQRMHAIDGRLPPGYVFERKEDLALSNYEVTIDVHNTDLRTCISNVLAQSPRYGVLFVVYEYLPRTVVPQLGEHPLVDEFMYNYKFMNTQAIGAWEGR